MTNESDRQNPAADAQAQPPRELPVAPAAPEQNKTGNDTDKRTKEEKGTAEELAREFRWVEGAQLIINSVLAVVGIIALCIYHGQLKVMQGQLGEIIKQYPEIKKSAAANSKAADQTEKAVNNAAADFRVDQRAWITLYAQILTKTPMDTPPNSIPMFAAWNNTGHTPALDAELTIGYLYSSKNYVSESSFSHANTTVVNPSDKITRAVYAPNGSGVSPPFYVPIPPPGKFVFVSVTVTYKDVFGEHHQTTSCMKVIKVGQLFNLVFCNAHNSED